MVRRILSTVFVGAVSLAAAACTGSGSDQQYTQAAIARDKYRDVTITEPLYATVPMPAKAVKPRRLVDPVVMNECRLNVFQTEEVPALRDGMLKVIGTEITVEEAKKLPKDEVFAEELGKKKVFTVRADKMAKGQTSEYREEPIIRYFRRLKEGDYVRPHQMMGILDDRVQRDDAEIKQSKVDVAVSDWRAATKISDEYLNRWHTANDLSRGNKVAISAEDVRLAQVQYEKAFYEAQTKERAIDQARLEWSQSKTLLEMHEIRSEKGGIFKTRHKKEGEAVKSLEPVFSVTGVDNLRVEGMAEWQHFAKLRRGMRAIVEPALPMDPNNTLVGHFQEITAVAVGIIKDKGIAASASEDNTIRLWSRDTSSEAKLIHLPNTIGRALACSPKGSAAGNFLLCGCADGTARLWDLDTILTSRSDAPTRELKDQHHGAITCVAFSPNGAVCATGGDDLKICFWDTKSGQLLYELKDAHRGPVTSIQFTPQGRLVSASTDNTLCIWQLGKDKARLEQEFERRSGDVKHIGVSPDGSQVLLDMGKQLRVLSVPDGLHEGAFQNTASAGNFSQFALFSPDGKLVVTSGGAEGHVQLWRAPTDDDPRWAQIRQLIPADREATITCAAFSPDGKFLVTGGKDRQVLVWQIPSAEKINQQITATITFVDSAVQSAGGQVRVWAEVKNPEMPNPDGKGKSPQLHPGSPATLVVYPPEQVTLGK